MCVVSACVVFLSSLYIRTVRNTSKNYSLKIVKRADFKWEAYFFTMNFGIIYLEN